MSEDVEKQIDELQQAIAAQENLRATLGDEMVEITIASLREQLELLKPSVLNERKLVTCLFCDIVGSTNMAANRDPEEVMKVVDGALREMATSISHFEGTVGRYMGDGILALFGAPKALESHAERAILAGLDIQRRMITYAEIIEQAYTLVDFKVRVGINTGYVIAGQVAGARGEYTVIGDAVNIAARFEALAPPGGILVGENTCRLADCERLFVSEPWAPIEVKGIDKPQRVYQILSMNDESRHPTAAAITRAPLTGRDNELKALKDRFQRARNGKLLQLATVSGQAGIGKSRLKQEFIDWLALKYPETHLWSGQSASYEAHSPFSLIRDLLQAALGINNADEAGVRRAKLEVGLSVLGKPSKKLLHSLAALLAIQYPDDSLSGLEPQARRDAIFEAFTSFCTDQTKLGELVLVLEDTHWADALSLELLEHVVGSLQETPLLVLMLTRPAADAEARIVEIRSQVPENAQIEVQLNELTPDEMGQMVGALLQDAEFPEWLLEMIYARAQGNPFFIEEIISSFIGDGTLEFENGDWLLTRDVADITVPDTVQAVLAARIDRLGPGQKKVIQHASIIGRRFWQRLLTDLVGRDVDEYLTRLAERDFVKRLGRATIMDDWEWIFRHVLVQEVAYDSLLKETRRWTHLQIAQWLEQHGSERLDELATTLAWHYEQGQEWEKALDYLIRSGDHAAGLVEYRAAASLYERALEAHAKIPGNPTRQQQFVELVLKLARVGATTPTETIAISLQEALATAEELQDEVLVARVLGSSGAFKYMRGQMGDALEYFSKCIELAERLNLDEELLVPYNMIGRAMVSTGPFPKAEDMLSKGITLAEKFDDREMLSGSVGLYAVALMIQGKRTESLTHVERGLQLARELSLGRVAGTLNIAGQGHRVSGFYEEAIVYFRRCVDIAEETQDIFPLYMSLGGLGYSYLQIGSAELALQHVSRSLQLAEQHKMVQFVPDFQACQAELDLLGGDGQAALEGATAAVTLAQHTKQRLAQGNVLRSLGRVYSQLDPPMWDKAEESLNHGIALQQKIGALAPAAISTFELGKLYLGKGAVDTARSSIEEAINQFTAFGMAWYVNLAQGLLMRLEK